MRQPTDWTKALIAATAPEARFQIDRIVLMKSTLARGGSVYAPVGDALLVTSAHA